MKGELLSKIETAKAMLTGLDFSCFMKDIARLLCSCCDDLSADIKDYAGDVAIYAKSVDLLVKIISDIVHVADSEKEK